MIVDDGKKTIATRNIPAATTMTRVVHEAPLERRIPAVASLDITLAARLRTIAVETALDLVLVHALAGVTVRATAHPHLVAAIAAALEAKKG